MHGWGEYSTSAGINSFDSWVPNLNVSALAEDDQVVNKTRLVKIIVSVFMITLIITKIISIVLGFVLCKMEIVSILPLASGYLLASGIFLCLFL